MGVARRGRAARLSHETRFPVGSVPVRGGPMSKTHEANEAIDVRDLPELEKLAEEVRRTGERRVLRRGDEDLAMIVPVPRPRRSRRREKTEAEIEAFLSAAGSWKDVDTDKLIEEIYADRRRSNRPPIEL
jgi:hypothetical protein